MRRLTHPHLVLFAGLLLGLTPIRADAPPIPSAAAIRDVLVHNFQKDQEAVLRYSYLEHIVSLRNGVRDGRTLYVYFINGHPVSETVALDNRPLRPDERVAEHRRALQRARDAAAKPPAPADYVEVNNKRYSFEKLADDFQYGPARLDTWRGRPTWVFPATPVPRLRSGSAEEQMLLTSRGEVWVDVADRHVVRIRVHTIAPVRYYLGLGAVIHSASVDLELHRHQPGEWLPAATNLEINATVLLVKTIVQSKQATFSDFKPLVAAPVAKLARR